MLECEVNELDFYQSLERLIEFCVALEIYEIGIYQDSVLHRHYHQLKSDILESWTGELGYYQSHGDSNPIVFRVRDI